MLQQWLDNKLKMVVDREFSYSGAGNLLTNNRINGTRRGAPFSGTTTVAAANEDDKIANNLLRFSELMLYE